MNKITINGVTIECESGNISVVNGVVKVDGKTVDCPLDTKEIIIEGNCNNVNITGNLKICGDVKGDVDITGNLKCDNIDGDVDSTGIVYNG